MDSPQASSRWFAFPRVLWLSLAAAAVVGSATLGLGFMNDDYAHRGIIEGAVPTAASRFDLFRFATGDPATLLPLRQRGFFPWWTLPELKLAFWRPLSSALMVLDHTLFGLSAMPYHLHSLAWYLGLVAVVGALLRRILPTAVGALALLLFAIDDAHFLVVGWIANRNALVAAVPALFGLWMHLEWREARRPWAMPLSLLGLALGLMGGESALGVFAYVLAYELLGAHGRMAERLRALAPATLLAVVYLVLYRAAGLGASGSGSYVDPVGESARFVASALGRGPALLGGLLLGAPADLWAMQRSTRPALVGMGLVALALTVPLVRWAWAGLTTEERRHGRWLFSGAALSLVPVLAVFPSNRLLLLPGLGGLVAVAMVLVHAWRSRPAWRGHKTAMAGAGLFALVHVVLAPLFWPLLTSTFDVIRARNLQVMQALTEELEPSRLPMQRVVMVSSPDPMLGMYLQMAWGAEGHPLPRAWWTLSLAPEDHVLTRTGPASLELELPRGHFHVSEFESVYRSPQLALQPGARVVLDGMEVTVLAGDAEGPTRLAFVFDVPLEDDSLVLLTWKDGVLRRMVPPPVGTRLALATAVGGMP